MNPDKNPKINMLHKILFLESKIHPMELMMMSILHAQPNGCFQIQPIKENLMDSRNHPHHFNVPVLDDLIQDLQCRNPFDSPNIGDNIFQLLAFGQATAALPIST